jgi:hypothetical protein
MKSILENSLAVAKETNYLDVLNAFREKKGFYNLKKRIVAKWGKT